MVDFHLSFHLMCSADRTRNCYPTHLQLWSVIHLQSPQSQSVSQSTPDLSAFHHFPPKPAWPLWKFCSIMRVDTHGARCFRSTIKGTSLEIASLRVWIRSWSQIDHLIPVAVIHWDYFIRGNIDVACTRVSFTMTLKKTKKKTHNVNMLSTIDESTNTVIVTLQRP